MPELNSANSPNAQGLRRWFYGSSGLRAGWRFLIFLAILIPLLGTVHLIEVRILHGINEGALFVINNILLFLIFLLASWIMGKMEGRRIADYGLPCRRMFRGQFWQGAAMGFASITVLLVALRVAGVFHFGKIALHGAELWKYAAIYTLVFILIGLREEFCYRGYALFTLATGVGFWLPAILLSAFFGYRHLGNTGETWIGAFNAGTFGLLCCLLLQRTGNLWMSIGFHAAWDWGETFFYGVADSGRTAPGHLFDSSSAGPVWLTGGSVGPEGSWLCILLLVALWFLFAAWFRETKYPDPAAIHDQRATSKQ